MDAMEYEGPLSITKSELEYHDCDICKIGGPLVAVEKREGYWVDVTNELKAGPRLWFSHHFICPRHHEYWFRPKLNGPVWHRIRNKVYLIPPEGGKRIWLLRDEFDENGMRLGVWPD